MNATKGINLPNDAEDTISSVSWSPIANHLTAASWDGKVRIYDVNTSTGAARGAAMLAAEGPILDCDWAKDGSMVVAGGADRKIHLLHLATGQQASLGPHDAPVRGTRFVDVPGCNAPIVASGSWDKTVRFWDLRQRDPLASIACEERVYAMDSKANLLVVATAGRRIHLFDLKNPAAISKTLDSQLKHQTKAVAAFPDGMGWATVSIEGRCGIHAVHEEHASTINFTFRCHRSQPDARKITKVWSVNGVQFHPEHKTVFSTASSDGTFTFWDRAQRTRLKEFPKADAAVTATAFNRDGSLFAAAVGYDWSFGCEGNSRQTQTRLALYPVDAADLRKKK
ncbi:WD40 repeat-like protein [Jackrogersella minutella]|nr:WD40 repeat-like protein [Jackrogersella minutella]